MDGDAFIRDVTGSADNHNHFDDIHNSDVYIGANDSEGDNFIGYLDDIMFWNYYALTADDVLALFQYSFGADATRLNFVLSNATGVGTTDDVLSSDYSFGVPWGDQMDYTVSGGAWAGGNWTSGPISEVVMDKEFPNSRLNFTISYASGLPLNLRIDDNNLASGGPNDISSYLQSPPADPELPVYHTHDRDNKVTFFAFNAPGGEGVWFTYQGTRIVFNGTNGHYTGIVDTVDGVSLSADSDSPFVDEALEADIVFWHPQNIPKASQPGEPLRIPVGDYDVSVYLNGYDEDGTVFIRSISIGTVLVVE